MNNQQYTKDWWMARRGKITGSRVDRVVNGTLAGWRTLARDLAMESLMSEPPPEPETKPGAREHGHEYEEVAIADAAIRLGFDYDLVGFKEHPDLYYLGASSDFRIQQWRSYTKPLNGEVKCPFNPEVHKNTWMRRQLPNRYRAQTQLQMACWGDDHTLFLSYCPMYIDHKQRGAEIIVLRDQNYIDFMLQRCDEFWHTLMEPKRTICLPTPNQPPPQLF